MALLRGTLLAGACLGFASLAFAEESVAPTPAPMTFAQRPAVQIVRTLQLMQDQVATGSTEAHVGQRGLVSVLEDRLMQLSAETWKDDRNVHAAVTFALSGGPPKILRNLLSPRLVSMEKLPLVEGALAYSEGREEEARRALMPIEASLLPAGIASQLALVQAALAVRTDPRKSMKLLDFVRIQAPGTLLEEAALRRQVFVASQLEDDLRFESLVVDYLRRFRRSVYAGNFRQRLAAALAKIDFDKDPGRFSRVVTMLSDLEPNARKDLFLLAARTSIENGRLKSALLTSEMALRLSEGDPQGSAQAKLYHASAMIVSPRSLDRGLEELKGVERSALPDVDLRLLDSALAMAREIRQLPGESQKAEKPSPKTAQVAAGLQAGSQLPSLKKAQDALLSVDRLFPN